jgi:hypothetical protein
MRVFNRINYIKVLLESDKMAISLGHSADDISKLFGTQDNAPERDSILDVLTSNDRTQMSQLMRRIATEIQARVSNLPFPDGAEYGFDPPSRGLAVTLKYLEEIGKELESTEFSTADLALGAFGTMVGVVASLLDHLSQQDYIPKS